MQAIFKFLFGALSAFIACNIAYYSYIFIIIFTVTGPYGERVSEWWLAEWWLAFQAVVISTLIVASFGASKKASLKNGVWFGSGMWVVYWITGMIANIVGI